jgi:6-pyruvoyltetrahydropterin/6-carboxytetrahydropterin synthase
MFDHTTIIAQDDPKLEDFKRLSEKKIIQLRIIDGVGCEKFAEYVWKFINEKISLDTNKRVSVVKVEAFEGETKNSAIFSATKK